MLVEQRFTEVVKVDFFAAGAGALVDDLREQVVFHPPDGSLDFPMRTSNALRVAGVRGFDANHGGERIQGKVASAAEESTRRLRRQPVDGPHSALLKASGKALQLFGGNMNHSNNFRET